MHCIHYSQVLPGSSHISLSLVTHLAQLAHTPHTYNVKFQIRSHCLQDAVVDIGTGFPILICAESLSIEQNYLRSIMLLRQKRMIDECTHHPEQLPKPILVCFWF